MENSGHRHTHHSDPTHEEIAVAAYYIWLHEEEHLLHHPDGFNPVKPATDNWYKAERQLNERFHLEDTCEEEL